MRRVRSGGAHSVFCLTRYHCRRLFASRRWLVILAMDTLLVAGAVIHLKSQTRYILTTYHLAVPPNVWDVPFDVCASNATDIFVLVALFVFLTCDALLRDEQSGRLPMLMCRTQDRATWFASLVPVLLLAAVVFAAAAVLVSLLAGLLLLPASASFSPFLTNTSPSLTGIVNFLPGALVSPPLFFLGVVGYLALIFSVVALSSVVVSLWWRTTIAAFLPIAWIFLVDYSVFSRLLQRGGGYERYTFSDQLAIVNHWQYVHNPTAAALYPFPVVASVIVLIAFCVLWSIAGYWSVQHVDL